VRPTFLLSLSLSFLRAHGSADLLLLHSYGTSYHGLMALQVGFLVAFTQLIPEHQVQIFGGLAKVRVKSLPMLYVTFSNIACVLGYISPYILVRPSSSSHVHLEHAR